MSDQEPGNEADAEVKAFPPRNVPHPINQQSGERALTVRVKFTRSINLGRRDEMAHISAELEGNYAPETDLAAVAALTADLFYTAKAVVFEQAGIDFTFDEGGVLHEVLRPIVQSTSSGGGGEEPAASSDFPSPSGMSKPAHVKAADWTSLCNDPSDWYDNRPDKASGKYKSTAPDFKHKDSGDAIWLSPPRRSSR